MRISFVTLFPEAVLAAVRHSMLERAERSGIVSFDAVNPRDFAEGAHRSVDDEPYGGGAGMVMMPEPLGKAIDSVQSEDAEIVFTDPNGGLFDQRCAKELSETSHVIFVCGHYEGIDERVAEKYATRRLSVGDFVLTGGELPAALMADAVVRLLPGVLGAEESLQQDAFADGLLTYPQYTRPANWQGLDVPKVLLSGDHGQISRWRRAQRLKSTRLQRPDLFAKAPITKDDLDLL